MFKDLLPVIHDDPFMKFRPFPLEDSDNLFINHWHEIAFMFMFYMIVQALTPIVCTRLLGNTYACLNNKTRINFDIHVVSMIQCVISLGTLAPMWNNKFYENRVQDPYGSIFGYFPYGGFVASCAVAYFIWDTYVCIRYFSSFGFSFLFHGVAALYVFSLTFKPICMPWVASFLIFEASTPFVNINWFASKLPAGFINEKVAIVNGICLLISFFSVRIIWGFYAVTLVATDMFRTWGTTNPIFPISILLINVFLDCLNLFWFYKMVMIAKKKFTKAKSKQNSVKLD